MAVTFNISPEKEASRLDFLKRQFFGKIPPVLRQDVDLHGRTAIVTGSNIGLGLECARQLLDLGCSKVILAVRNEAKGEAARQGLSRGRDLKPGTIEVWKLDLSSYDSIIAFAERAKSLERLDLAILNAGIFKVSEVFHPTTGYEEDVQINYLSNMLLITLLLPILVDKKRSTTPGRIVLVNSDMSGWAKFEERSASPLLPAFKQKTANWDMSERYGTSKLLGQLFLVELTKRVASSIVTVTCCNPGMCYGTALSHEGPAIARGAFWVIQHIIGRSCSVGARTYVHAAVTLGEEAHGQYVEDRTLHP
jgi:NAD(P)-dependent dehydrogenase (short-subunit alcohol dehydrogenase family)